MNSDQISASIRSGYLHLDRKQNLRHYKYGFLIVAAGAVIALILLEEFYVSSSTYIFLNALFLILGITVLFIQRLRLKMEVVETSLSQKQIIRILRTVAKSRGWRRFRDIKECYVARCPYAGKNGVSGEMVTVLFGDNKVFISSIPEPKGNMSLSTYRRTRKSVHVLSKVIRNHSTGH